MFRVVQTCVCGCGKRRAQKSDEPITSQVYHHDDLAVKPINELVIKRRLNEIAEVATAQILGEMAKLTARIEELEHQLKLALGAICEEAELTRWQRIKRFIWGRV